MLVFPFLIHGIYIPNFLIVYIFDEYACDKWSESNAVDKFLKEHPNLELKTIPWSRTPSAYLLKK